MITLFNNVSARGGADLTRYSVQVDDRQGGGWQTAASGSVASYILTQNIIAGVDYRVRYRAENAIGASEYSDVTIIRPASQPAQMQPPSLSLTLNLVRIAWVLPSPRGEPITAVRVTIAESDGQYRENEAVCNAIVGQLYCEIEMRVFSALPYSFSLTETIRTKVQAMNSRGWGIDSDNAEAEFTVQK